ncbi:unnamed protein product [Scytosiphon promiscuus]
MTRAAAVNLKELMLTVQQQKYEDRDKAAQRQISQKESCEGEQSILKRDERRSRWLLRSSAKREFLQNWERDGRRNWNANQAALCRYERRLLNYELAVKATAQARKRLSRARHFNDETEGIQWFEHNLDRLGLDPGGGGAGGGPGGGAAGSGVAPDKETSATFRSRLVRTVLDQKFVPSSNAETMAELRFRGTTGRRGRQEREHRRVKTDVDQRRAQTETDAQRKAENDLKGMLNEGRERREAAAASWRAEHERQQKALSDEKRFAEKSAALDGAFEVAFNARASHVRQSYEESKDAREAKEDALRVELHETNEKKRRGIETMCRHVAHKLSDLAVVASEARVLQGGIPLAPTTWANLKRWFCSPEPFFVDATPPEPLPEPSDPVLDAKVAVESLNLDRHEGPWRLRWDPQQIPPIGPSPLSRALAVARELSEASGSGPREAPTCTLGGGEMSVRLVLLGRRDDMDNLLEGLGRWTRLYVCSLETALECAMAVGAEIAASEGKGTKGRKASALGKNVVGSDAEPVDTESEEMTIQRCFHPEATEETVAAFKEAAVAYHALRTNPKKASTPVPSASTTDLLVKHLECRAPRGRGWILVGYPKSLLESKMLENALSGYADEEVATELGTSGKASKADSKTKKGSIVPQQQEDRSQTPLRSGLDAILMLTSLRSTAPRRTSHPSDLRTTSEDGGAATVSSDELADAPSTQEAGAIHQSKLDEDVVDDSSPAQKDAQSRWWQGFEGGHLACDVPDEANDERLLETLFLLVNAAQIRKNEHQVFEEAARKSQEERAAQALESGSAAEPDGGANSPSTTATAIDRPSPLTIPLTSCLEDSRRQRRRRMSHATRIWVEALSGDRELDLDGIRTVISHANARKEGPGASAVTITLGSTTSPPSASSPCSTQALRKLEAECSALFVVDWAAAAEFSFSTELRNPDQRWTAACNKLEGEIASWLERRRGTLPAGRSTRSRGGPAPWDGRGCPSAATAAVAMQKENCVWQALEAFQLEAGDVVDDRHSSVEAVMKEIGEEAGRRVRAWTRNVENAAAGLCVVERATHLETVAALGVLDRLFGLEDDERAGTADQSKGAACAAVDALGKELSTALGDRLYPSEGGAFKEELRRTIEEVYEECRATSPAHDPSQKLAALQALDSASQPEAPSSQRCQDVGDGLVHGDDIDEASICRVSSATISTTTAKFASGSSKGDTEEEAGALAIAVWRCRHTYICRLRGLVMRMLRAIEHCEAKVSSMLAALRRLKRHRVQVEHEGISTGTAVVRRALEECDFTAIADILENGIPVWVEDDETFAPDPFVALPWGMSGLGLPQIASLADTLRRSLSEAGGCPTEAALVPVLDVSRAVKTWSRLQAAGENGGGVGGGIPQAWVSPSGEYTNVLCGAIATNTDQVSWRRLVHCLLLGHVRSIPTPDELRSMRRTFTLKASAISQTPPEQALKTELATEEVKREGDSAIAQRHFQAIPLWFERHEIDERYGPGNAGSDSWSSMIRAVYSAAWGGADGRVDGIGLLLELCHVPDHTTAGGVGALPVDGDDVEDTGIPFSAGLFRAFYMLAENQLSPTDHATTIGQSSAGGAKMEIRSSSTGSLPVAAAASTNASSSADQRNNNGFPRVTLPQLRAILGHGGMEPAEVSDVCDFVAKTDAEQQTPGQAQGRELQRDKVAVDNATPAHESSLEHGVVAAGKTTVRDTDDTGVDEEDRDTELGGTATLSVGGEGADDGQDNRPREENPPFTVSFAAVLECKTVRDWVRKGAYTLPAFDVTSGQRPGISEKLDKH